MENGFSYPKKGSTDWQSVHKRAQVELKIAVVGEVVEYLRRVIFSEAKWS